MTNVVMFVPANYQESILKTALITGANKGIGYETARQLAAKGFHVFLAARNADSGRKAADALAKKGAKVTFLQLDVSDLESVSAAPSEFAKAADHLDVIVNNAGTLLDGDSALLTIDDELIRKTLETNSSDPCASRGVCPVAYQKQRTACNQCLQRRRPIDRRS